MIILFSFSAQAHDAGDFIVRAGVAHVAPQESANPDIVGLSSDTQLGLTGTYMFTNNIGLEVLASSPFTHNIDLKGGGTLAEVKQLPPTISAQYFFNNNSIVTPYVGAGINYFMVLESDMTSYGETTLGTNNIDVGDSVGLALSAGLDINITDNLIANAAVWHIDVETTADINDGALKIDVDIDPWVYMIGLGYKF